jgi:hypothetical protein
MTPEAPRRRREGWPLSAARQPAPSDDMALRESEALVHATALAVARLTEELRLALRRFEEARAEARVVSECVAARSATRVIAHARCRFD